MLQAEKIARHVAAPMNFLSTITHPFVWVLSKISYLFFKLFNVKTSNDNAVTEEEIKAMITEGSEHGTIEEEEKEIIERVFHLGDRNITSLMTHRTDIAWFDGDETVQQVKDKLDIILEYDTFDGIFAMSDETLAGLNYALKLKGISAKQFKVAAISEGIFPKYLNPHYEFEKNDGMKMGMMAANILLEKIKNPENKTANTYYI